jgi:hypothetical protein
VLFLRQRLHYCLKGGTDAAAVGAVSARRETAALPPGQGRNTIMLVRPAWAREVAAGQLAAVEAAAAGGVLMKAWHPMACRHLTCRTHLPVQGLPECQLPVNVAVVQPEHWVKGGVGREGHVAL